MNILKILILKIMLVLILVSQPSFFLIYADENDGGGAVASWFDWKIRHLDNEEQKMVMKYFEKINFLFEKAKETEYSTKESVWGHPSPAAALKIIDNSIKEAKKIKSPKSCLAHYSLTLKALQYIRNYQLERLRVGTDEKFESKRKQDQIYEVKVRDAQLNELRLEEQRTREYFKILHKIGLYDNVLDEMLKLKLITKEEKEHLEASNR